jgi:hypothetical protein
MVVSKAFNISVTFSVLRSDSPTVLSATCAVADQGVRREPTTKELFLWTRRFLGNGVEVGKKAKRKMCRTTSRGSVSSVAMAGSLVRMSSVGEAKSFRGYVSRVSQIQRPLFADCPE